VSVSSTPTEPAVSATAAQAEVVLVLNSAGQPQNRPASAVRSHDFRQSGFLAPSELRRIRLRHEQFIRSLAARLAIFLRLEVSVQLTKVQITSYQKFAEALGSPTHITLFRTEPLKGVGLLVIPPRLGLGFVDRLLGGPGQMPESAKELSEIEIALIDQIATLTLAEWCAHWPEMKELQPALLGHENNSRFLQTAPPDTAMLVLTIDTGMAGVVEPVQLVFPYATVEPLMKQLAPALPESEPIPARSNAVQWNAEFDDLEVNASVEWQGLRITAAEITRLKTGDVLMLAPGCAGRVQLSLGKTPKFLGKPGVCGSKWAVQLTDVIAE
jgi:flagellar motor switch protein FliM